MSIQTSIRNMKWIKIFLLLVGLAALVSTATASEPQRIYLDLTFHSDEDVPELNNVSLTETSQLTSLGEDHGQYEVRLLNDRGNIVEEGTLAVGFELSSPPVWGEDGEMIEESEHFHVDEVDRNLFLRFHESVTKVRWLKNDEAVKDIDLVQRFCSSEDEYMDYCERHGAYASTFSQEWFDNFLFDETPWGSPILWITFIALTTTFLIYRRKRSSKTDQTEFKQYDREKDERNF